MLLNVGLVCVPFWLFEVAQRSSRARRWLAYAAGFLVGLLIVGSMVLALWWVYAPPGHQSAAADLASVQVLSTPSPPTAQPVATTKHYSDTETGVSFDYPEYLTLEAQTQKRREATGQVVTFTLISAQSSDPFMAIIVRLIEDPLREELYPNLYPPTESSLRMLLRSEIVDLELSTSTDKIDAVLEASNKAQLTAVGGYPAALYTLVLTTTDYGDLYLRGAMIVTDRRDISVHIIGSTEPDIPGSVQPGVIDQVWSQVIKSFSADY
ncbi:MAG: hypothetical protein JXC32_11255 [Anaerolineae bacterium]|nr:hypothetical protein [Anaerolineae bacterium]